MDFYYHEPTCVEEWTDGDPRPAFVKNVHYMYFALILFWLTIITAVIISLMTAPLPEKHLVRTTYWTRNDPHEVEDKDHVDETAGIHDDEQREIEIPLQEKNKDESTRVDGKTELQVEHHVATYTF
ncbi:PREDICTED: sodium/glucose cotransporter 4-like, partial [Priapulus caudatus]|uniref:Sodium/glucose cotransporter 4-like n=1 Tax=Priapulus caudatus TaxID=37621 RepID=A0ABM1ETK3_PRICU